MLEFTGFVRPNVSPRLFAACTFLMLIVVGKCYYIFIALCVSFREGFDNCYGYNSIWIFVSFVFRCCISQCFDCLRRFYTRDDLQRRFLGPKCCNNVVTILTILQHCCKVVVWLQKSSSPNHPRIKSSLLAFFFSQCLAVLTRVFSVCDIPVYDRSRKLKGNNLIPLHTKVCFSFEKLNFCMFQFWGTFVVTDKLNWVISLNVLDLEL